MNSCGIVRCGELECHVLTIFKRVGRTIAPSTDVWHRSGDVLAEMAKREGLEIDRVSQGFANDVLLPLSCQEAGCVLVTDSERDFRRSRRFVNSISSSRGPVACCR